MAFKHFKKKLGLSDAQLASLFSLSVDSYRNSSAKARYELALFKFIHFLPLYPSFYDELVEEYKKPKGSP